MKIWKLTAGGSMSPAKCMRCSTDPFTHVAGRCTSGGTLQFDGAGGDHFLWEVGSGSMFSVICSNCLLPAEQHTDGIKCLFEPTSIVVATTREDALRDFVNSQKS